MERRGGFTILELMIVVAIIAIVAAIAIPNLMQSRVRANEATAVTTLKNYSVAQVTFQTGKMGRVPANTPAGGEVAAYCEIYPNLFYGNPALETSNADTTQHLALISKAHADAYVPGLVVSRINAVPTAPPAVPTPHQGYHFANPSGLDADHYLTKFSQLALPAKSASTGNNAYWVSIAGTVYFHGLPKGQDPVTSLTISTPDTSFTGWLNL